MPNRLALLGSVRLTGPEGAPIRRASQQRRIALLAVIAASPDGCVSRDRLLGLLWPDRDERSARHLLADSLYILRQTFGDDAIVASAEALGLSRDLVWTDVVEFRRAVAEERWSDALELYRGDFLDAFYVRNAADFDRWAHAERTRFRSQATRAASALARALETTGRIAEAIAAAERALELAPCDEAVFRELVRLLIAAENRARVELVARAFIERVALEVGVAPSAETMRMVREAGALADAEPIVVVAPAKTRTRRKRSVDSTTAAVIAQGRYHWQQRTRASVERAISYFTRATERDPRAVDAWCGLTDCWNVLAGRGYVPTDTAVAQARASANRALAIDDSLASVHTSIGGLNIILRRWRDAEAALGRATRIDPRDANAHHWLALTLSAGFGDVDRAVRSQTIATRLDPVSAMHIGALGQLRYFRGEYELSRSSLETAFHLNADFEEGHAGLARVAARLGDEATVLATIESSLARRVDLRGDLLAEHASALSVLGYSRRAHALARQASAHGAMPINLALAWASLGNAERAFEHLARESFLAYWTPLAVWWDPRFDVIRDDARFVRVQERMQRVWNPDWR
jgi:DNA-binding SARP family transcriptional activator